MERFGKTWSIPLLVMGLLSMGGTAWTQAPSLRVGEPFPRIVLPSLRNGSPLSIQSFAGKKLILHIWASW